MKKLLTIAFLGASLSLSAQQDAQFTNYLFNKMALNPAYAGMRGVGTLTGLYRQQWMGFEGAPSTQTLSFHAPVADDRMGIGAVVSRDQIGFTQTLDISGNYAYRIPVGEEGVLGLGISASLRHVRADWSKADPAELGDMDIPMGVQQKVLPNFGAGAFVQMPMWWAGVSVPELLRSNLDWSTNGSSGVYALRRRHIFAMGGLSIPMGEGVEFQPSVGLKFVSNAPASADATLAFMFLEKLTLGANWRIGDSVDGFLHWRITPAIRLGMGYDYTINKLQNYQSGSFEVLLGYDFVSEGSRIYNPRFF